jgi:NitT/TauT family transport system substrate-binding protein
METSHRGLAHTKKKLRGLAALTAAVIGIGVAGCASPAPTKSAPSASPSAVVQVEKLNVSYIGSGTASLPLFIGLDRGYFADAHLEITSQSFGTAPYPQAVAGEVDIISGDHVGALQTAVGGLPLVFLAETSRMIPGQHQFVTPETSRFKKPKDLKGARIGMSSLVGSAKFALDAMLEVAGLTEKDVQVSKLALDALGPAL